MFMLIQYALAGAIIAFLFKMTVSLVTTGIGRLFFGLVRRKYPDLDAFIARNPMKCISYGILLNIAIGGIYAIIIAIVTEQCIYGRGGSPWLYWPLAFFWALTILYGAEAFRETLLISCMVTLAILCFHLALAAPIAWVIIAAASFVYYVGRFEMLREQMRRTL